ncbi:MAG: hypothetical protein OHK93_000618 [Ramalina farinacea]|uniref:Tryptophan synthase beta chain-like PALP domain-containing protein n=1 Tax=Ramalina farinacea TaxID=258253 RepID=A0AA43QJI6_9LECA|nr:hypothetical protein [Ramalina farinacea]
MTDPSRSLPLTRSSVAAAHDRIKSHIHRTPVLTSSSLNAIVSAPQSPESLIGTPWHGQAPSRPKINLFFKCENFQKIGAFKIRGASHALSRLSREELGRGVVTHSSGNHAQALALAATRFQTTAHIVMPTISTPSKIAATKGYGAHVYFSGSTSDEREAVVREVMANTGAVLVPPYDHPDIILGQGTMALELEEQVRELVGGEAGLSVHRRGALGELDGRGDGEGDGGHAEHHLNAVIAPLGGGGMLAGVATALDGTPTRVYGAEPSFQGADDGKRGLEAGKRVTKVSTLTIADGLRTPVGEINWTIISDKEKVKGVFAVTEEQIKKAMKLVLERLKVFVEPSACVGLAVVMFDEGFRRECEKEGGLEGWDVGIILSGGNVSVEGVAEMFKSDGKGRHVDGQKTNGEREEGVVGLDGARKAENVAG